MSLPLFHAPRLGRVTPRLLLAVVLLASPVQASPKTAAPKPEVVQTGKQAQAAHKAGNQKLAAELYFRAHQMDPGNGEFLWASARALQLDGQLHLAMDRYRAFLTLYNTDPELRQKAKVYLAEAERALEAQRAQVPSAGPPPEAKECAAEAPAEATASTASSHPPSPTGPADTASVGAEVQTKALVAPPAMPSTARQIARWSAVGVAVGGAILLAIATDERTAFDKAMAPGWSGARVTAYGSRQEATDAGNAIALRQNLGGVIVAAGVTGALVAWLWPVVADRPAAASWRLVATIDGGTAGISASGAW